MANHENSNLVNEADWLSLHRRSITSQSGEDGVIEKIFEVIGKKNNACVEFGGWDGKHLSNTWDLLNNKEWSGVVIEADKRNFKKLVDTYRSNGKVVCINRFVNFEGENTLDKILSGTAIPEDFDLLSIDIDGNDYHVWEAFESYRPRLVVIEFNPTIPVDLEFVQPRNMKLNQGSSLLSLYMLAKHKGYELVATTECNAFFVRGELFSLFKINDNSPLSMRKERKYETRLFQLYDGTIVLAGCKRLLWHNIDMDQRKMQVLPFFLRTHPSRRSLFSKIYLRTMKLGRGNI